MTKENKPTHDKHEHAAKMNWLRVLESVRKGSDNRSFGIRRIATLRYLAES